MIRRGTRAGWLLGAIFALVAVAAAASCGDDSTGGAGGAASASGGSAAGGAGGAGGSGGMDGSGGSAEESSSAASSEKGEPARTCKELTPDRFARDKTFDEFETEAILSFSVEIGSGEDSGIVEFLDPASTGTLNLTTLNNSNYGTCTTCVLVTDRTPGEEPRTFFQQSGTVELGDTTFPVVTGKLSDVTLVEVTVDPLSLVSTEVEGGACYHIAEASFAFEPAPPGWLCSAQEYADHRICECGGCGVPDPDCDDPSLSIYGCEVGQTCVAAQTCAGVPDAWTCDPADYGAGAGNGCQCDCGTYDPDCDLPGEVVSGCDDGSACNHASACVPPGWTCAPDSWGDDDCDCLCGIHDPTCEDPNAYVAGCQFGQMCPGTVCEGAPPEWTCDVADFAGGPGNGCHCGCGVYDPDCDDSGEPVVGCADDATCFYDTCVPNAWTCDPFYFGDTTCDCGCGALDMDCADGTIGSCLYCKNDGSCSTEECPGTIDPNDNSVCQ